MDERAGIQRRVRSSASESSPGHPAQLRIGCGKELVSRGAIAGLHAMHELGERRFHVRNVYQACRAEQGLARVGAIRTTVCVLMR